MYRVRRRAEARADLQARGARGGQALRGEGALRRMATDRVRRGERTGEAAADTCARDRVSMCAGGPMREELEPTFSFSNQQPSAHNGPSITRRNCKRNGVKRAV